MSKRLSDLLLSFKGSSPFGEAQAREFSDTKVLNEFYPTSTFWNLFNHQHEILIGTRGSGKTFLLRMLSYSCLRQLADPNAKAIVESKAFIGFYIPLHLEFMLAIEGDDGRYDQRIGYFSFAFNCAAVTAFLAEVFAVLRDTFVGDECAAKEYKLAKALSELWFPGATKRIASIAALQTEINQFFYQQPKWDDSSPPSPLPRFAEECMRPVRFALAEVYRILGLNADQTAWIACIDETEFVKPPFLRCLNTALRSAKRPLLLKVATLPFKHSTCATVMEGVSIEPNGNDFNYRRVDLEPDSSDFFGLTNHLCKRRLSSLIPGTDPSLEEFLGRVGRTDSLIDYFRAEMGDEESEEEVILQHIIEELSETRRRTAAEQAAHESLRKPIYNRFYPVYFARRLKREMRGNRLVGWFAGSRVVRMVSDGNPRRFIQLMNAMFEQARSAELTPKCQHRVVVAFCERALADAQGLPELGHITKELIRAICEKLAERVHGEAMVDGGCGFVVDDQFLGSEHLAEALKLAIAYSHIVYEEVANGTLQSPAEMRLSFIHAVNYWLPMRKGDLPKLRPNEALERLNTAERQETPPRTRKKSEDFVERLQLQLFERE